jgi:putative transposase
MPRRSRELVPGGYYHVISRGVEQRMVLLDDTDRRRFVGLLGAVVVRHEWACLAYCLMGNHYHLLIRTPQPDLPEGMQHLNGEYARGFNQRHRRVGHLFQDRYKSLRIKREAHLWATVRYIGLNPVAAGLSARPEGWEWSSHRAAIGAIPAGFVAVAELIDLFGAAFGAIPEAAQRLATFLAPMPDREPASITSADPVGRMLRNVRASELIPAAR